MGDRRPARWECSVDEAWREFRRQLADHVAVLEDDEILHLVTQSGTDEEELDGARPYVQLVGWAGGQRVRAEASSNHYLDERYRLDERAAEVLVAAGWSAPTRAPEEPCSEPPGGSPNWWADAGVREADLVASLATVALRDAFGCPHPVFVRVEGRLVLTGAAAPAVAVEAAERASAVDGDEPELCRPQDPDELREQVVAALRHGGRRSVETDEDGDVPLLAGGSVLYVQPLDDEPTVRLWARLVTGVDDLERAADEVAIMNRDLVFGAVVLTDSGCIDFRHHLCAMPLVPEELRRVVARVLSDLDRRAGDFVRRVGGRRFLDDESGQPPSEEAEASDVPDVADVPDVSVDAGGGDPGTARRAVPTELLVLRELLEAGAADPRTVATLWDGDLRALALQIDELRTEPPAVIDVADAIAVLRDALVFVAERRSRARWSRPARPSGRRPVSRQEELIGSRELGEATLDLGTE